MSPHESLEWSHLSCRNQLDPFPHPSFGLLPYKKLFLFSTSWITNLYCAFLSHIQVYALHIPTSGIFTPLTVYSMLLLASDPVPEDKSCWSKGLEARKIILETITIFLILCLLHF